MDDCRFVWDVSMCTTSTWTADLNYEKLMGNEGTWTAQVGHGGMYMLGVAQWFFDYPRLKS